MNSFGRVFRVSIFGESHGNGVGITIDGCPPGILITVEDFEKDLAKRRSGAKGTTLRKEADIPEILSGIYNNRTTGSPITIIFKNKDTKSSDYKFKTFPRPGHADFVAEVKHKGFQDDRGGGHFSGRLTVGIVAAGVIAKKILKNVIIETRIPEAGGSSDIDKAVNKAIESGDSIGALIECRVNNVPVGWGEPFFGSVESVISHAIFSIPAIKGIEFGSGFKSAEMKGSEHNDMIIDKTGKTYTNNAGGISGGITNGNNIIFRVAVKPTSSISLPQETFNFKNNKIQTLKIEGRHDACIAIRILPVIEAITAIALTDLKLLF